MRITAAVIGLMLMVPIRAEAQEPRILYPALATATAFDVDSTRRGLRMGMKEINPIVLGLCLGKSSPNCATAITVGQAVFLTIGAEGLRKQGRRKAAFWLVFTSTALKSVVAWNNYRQIEHLRSRRQQRL